MAGGAKRAPQCGYKNKSRIDDGTLCKQESPRPGPVGILDWTSTFRREATEWFSGVGSWMDRAAETAFGQGKSLLLTLVDLLPFKEQSPFSTALLKHYVERSGDPYRLEEIPSEWQAWIVKATGGRPGMHRGLNPYNSGLYDLRNSLGHFNVEVKANRGGTRTYSVSDVYEFGAMKNDKRQRGRHGFPLGNLTEWQIAALHKLMPKDEYLNRGGFKERWEIKSLGKETILFIPQEYLARQGKAFKVTGVFTR